MLCSHINNSQANESWLRDTITNSCEETGEVGDTERCLFDLVIVTRKRSGPGGKLDIAHKVFPSAEFLILDDQVEVIAELVHQVWAARIPDSLTQERTVPFGAILRQRV